MARITKTKNMLTEQMVNKIHDIEMLCIEIIQIYNSDYNYFEKSLTIMTIEDVTKDLVNGEDALYILRSKFGKD